MRILKPEKTAVELTHTVVGRAHTKSFNGHHNNGERE